VEAWVFRLSYKVFRLSYKVFLLSYNEFDPKRSLLCKHTYSEHALDFMLSWLDNQTYF
jgi:hypothetical protein